MIKKEILKIKKKTLRSREEEELYTKYKMIYCDNKEIKDTFKPSF